MKKKYVHVKKLCECGCGEEIGLRREDRIKNAKFKGNHKKNKREILFIDEKCECGCGEIIGNWKFRPERNAPKFKLGHYFRKNGSAEYKGNKGYSLVYVPEYKNANKNGTMLEHRYVMEQHLQRDLLPSEDIHHINGIKNDNRIENLEVIDHAEHSKMHRRIERERCLKDGETKKGNISIPRK